MTLCEDCRKRNFCLDAEKEVADCDEYEEWG